jgi:AspT/YidE/YbjL antiporter-like protein
MASSGSPFADKASKRLSASKNPGWPIVPPRESKSHSSDSHRPGEGAIFRGALKKKRRVATLPSSCDTGHSGHLSPALGVLLAVIPIPIPGVGRVTLGIVGGPLIVALIVGKLRRTGPLLWVMPLPANIVLRNFGLALFLAAVGINAGQPFVRTVSETGLTMVLIGAVVLLTTVLIVLLVGYYLLKIPYEDLVGVASGATGNPAILVYSTRMAPSNGRISGMR